MKNKVKNTEISLNESINEMNQEQNEMSNNDVKSEETPAQNEASNEETKPETKDKVLNDKIEELFTMVENLKKENEELKSKSIPVYSISEMYKILEEKKDIQRKIDIFQQTHYALETMKTEIIETDENLLESKLVKIQLISGNSKVICSISNLLVITEMIDFLTGKVNERVNLLESKLVRF